MLSRPESPPTPAQSEEGRYRSLASVRAWTVVTDSVLLYGRRFFSFIAASLLSVLPSVFLQTWQLQRAELGFAPEFSSSLLVWVLLMIWGVFWVVLMVRLAADEIEGVQEGIGGAVGRLSVPIVLLAAVAELLVSLATGLASLLLIIPGIIVAVKLALTLPVVVCERCGPIEAMKRSSRLVKGHGGSVFGAICLVFLASVTVAVVGVIFMLTAKGEVYSGRSIFSLWFSGTSALLQAVLTPLWAIMPTLFYAALSSKPDAAEPGPQQGGTYGTMPPVASRSE